jgi:hypothetical protein
VSLACRLEVRLGPSGPRCGSKFRFESRLPHSFALTETEVVTTTPKVPVMEELC